MANYAIGDVQGCDEPLLRLLEEIKFDPAVDRLWFCGDLVNRGGRSLEVLRRVFALREQSRVVLGNHDLHLLAYARSRRQKDPNPEFDEILAAGDGPELIEWLQGCPLMIQDPDWNMVLVHAGLLPNWDLAMALSLAAELETALRADEAAAFLRRFHDDAPHWDEALTGWDRLRAISAVLTRIRFCDVEGHIDHEALAQTEPGVSRIFRLSGHRQTDLTWRLQRLPAQKKDVTATNNTQQGKNEGGQL